MDDIQTEATSKQLRCIEWKTENAQNGSVLLNAALSSSTRVYGCSNLYYSSCRVLNVMRKCQPTGKTQFLTRFAIIRSSWGCTDVWRALMECQRKGQTMQILFVQPNQKSHKGNYPFAESVPPSPCHFFFFLFFKIPSFECHWQRPSARLQLRSQQGGTARCFSPPAETTSVGEQNDYTC